MNLLSVSDQADVNALAVHWSTPWSIGNAFEFEEANVDRKKRRKVQRMVCMLGGCASKGKGNLLILLTFMNDQFGG